MKDDSDLGYSVTVEGVMVGFWLLVEGSIGVICSWIGGRVLGSERI